MNFDELEKIDCSEKIEKRSNGSKELSYLSWAWAWSIFKKKCPDATYTIKKFQNSKNELVPYMYDENTGYMVNTEITADGITYEMWLPVMNTANKAMKALPYEYNVKNYGKIETKMVEAATMFDINKTIMRCLVKNMAMFGLGLYIYAGEDLPENEEQKPPKQEPKKPQPVKKEIISDNDFDIIAGLEGISDLKNLEMYYRQNKDKVTDIKAYNTAVNARKDAITKGV